MTTVSAAYIGRLAIKRLRDTHPEICESIARISGVAVGNMRVARVYYKDSRYLQVPLGWKGTHTAVLVDALVEALVTPNDQGNGPRQAQLAEGPR
ncbi:MAG: hypothetical protein JNM98_21800 [Rhodocyclaceae bacterium]|nr:hypothetical protein [Rhodocyclaceae bacterium]